MTLRHYRNTSSLKLCTISCASSFLCTQSKC